MNVHTSQPRTPAETALIEAFSERVGDLPGNADVAVARDTALEALKIQGLPSRRIESWHYTDFRTLLRSVAPFDAAAGSQPIAPLIAGSTVAAVSNGATISAGQADGVTFGKLSDKLADGTFAPSLATRSTDDLIGQINAAYVTDGWSVDIAEGTQLGAPIELQNLQKWGQGHVRFPVRVGRQAKATIVERQYGGEDEAFSSSISQLTLADGAEVVWIILRQHSDTSSVQLAQFNASLGKDARLTLFIVNAGGKLVRQEVHVQARGEGSDFQLRGINLLGGATHTDVTMTVGHLVENTTSTEIVRNVVTGRARGAFQGMIRVAQIAQKTDARMACNSLLLSDDSEFDAKPELEIFADDVACGHGATVAEIDQDHLFYLMARGIPEKEARGLLVKAFVAEIIEELEDEPLVDVLEGILEDWLSAHG